MDKGFHFYAAFFLQLLHFLKGQLSGGHYPADPQVLQEPDALGSRDGKLGGGVEKEARASFPQGGNDPQVLDDDSVQALFIHPGHKIRKLGKLFLSCQGIDRQIDLSAKKMGLFEAYDQFFLCEISGVGPGPKFLSRQIDGVRSGADCSQKGFSAARGGQQFHCMHHSFVLYILLKKGAETSAPGVICLSAP